MTGITAKGTSNLLTEKQLQVEALVVQGLSNRQIASELSLSCRTVESHVARILERRCLESRVEIATQWFDANAEAVYAQKLARDPQARDRLYSKTLAVLSSELPESRVELAAGAIVEMLMQEKLL